MADLVLLDISRLLSRAGRPAPTGIDRVELAYAERLAPLAPAEASFVARGPLGEITVLPGGLARRFVAALGRRWRGEAADRRETVALRRWAQLHLVTHREWELHLWLRLVGRPATLVLASHKDLDRPGAIARLKKISGVRFAAFIHDLIPMELPQFAGEGQAEKHRRRMTTAARLADQVLVNSAATAEAFARFCASAGRTPPIAVAPLGVETAAAPAAQAGQAGAPYFVVLSTLEPKKNHLLLFEVWRRLAREDPNPPRLVLIGQRGWKTEAIVEALADPVLRPFVQERPGLSDPEARALVAGARALLAPSLAEGFGLPVAEALALGAPVICSDLAAHRGVGGAAAEYLDPHDPAAWLEAVRDYAAEGSPRRAAQLDRIAAWRAPSWDDHFAQVMPLIARR